MKRFFFTLCIACLCLNLNAQIQTKFWGLELSKTYTSLGSAKTIISDKCDFSEIDKTDIVAYEGSFGGYTWDSAYFCFHADRYGYSLYEVIFSSHYKSSETARSRYNSLLKSLNNKYGEHYSSTNTYQDTSVFWKENRYACFLSIRESESRGGELFWYVTLTYLDSYYLDLSIEEGESEL